MIIKVSVVVVFLMSLAAAYVFFPKDISWISGFWKIKAEEGLARRDTLHFDENGLVFVNGEVQCDYLSDWFSRIQITCMHPGGALRSIVLTPEKNNTLLSSNSGDVYIRF